MSENKSFDPTKVKIFPRNLTAKADYIVRGNPANSRPESGVQNCYPGLELDIRNMEQCFFKGLRFEFHRDEGAILVHVDQDSKLLINGLNETDWKAPNPPLYLWALYGRVNINQPEPTLWGFRGQSGLEVWARVHDLLPGRVAILLGPAPGFSSGLSVGVTEMLLNEVFTAGAPEERFKVERDKQTDKLIYAVFSDYRADYIDEHGVINVNTYKPGEFTKSLCAPWIYDFRDCVCFYWSSNKPDIVDSADGKFSFINYMRREEDRRTDTPPPKDIEVYRGRRDNELTYEDMTNGWWEKLPVVFNDRESTSFTPRPHPPLTDLLTRDHVIAELTYLATVEHALIVEYLYAMYSIEAPLELDTPLPDEKKRRIFDAAQEVFRVAVDEMRHFRWVNEVLGYLNAPPSTGRAKIIGEPPQPASGRKMDMHREYLARPFSLKPLTRETLQWFIDVEAPSQQANQQLDGMYVAILESINFQTEIFPEHEKVLPIIKLIIDEGEQHYERFSRIQLSLAPYGQREYLRDLTPEPSPHLQNILNICDQYYQSIIEVIQITSTLGDRSGGNLVKAAVRTMINLNEAAHLAASQGILPEFNLAPEIPKAKILAFDEALNTLSSREMSIETALGNVADSGTDDEKTLAHKHMAVNAILYQKLRDIVREGVNAQ